MAGSLAQTIFRWLESATPFHLDAGRYRIADIQCNAAAIDESTDFREK
jgi:hypothetical protein